mmetsp:Transcript_8826/g.13979  ORF Transcript_8826/g.13979 Transcript_8826/m.13979 type:complete len:102 (+) Transcript_8826:120-425(+)
MRARVCAAVEGLRVRGLQSLVLRVQARSLASNVEQTPAQAVPSDAKKGNQGKWFMSSLDEVYRGNPYSGVNPEEPPRLVAPLGSVSSCFPWLPLVSVHRRL